MRQERMTIDLLVQAQTKLDPSSLTCVFTVVKSELFHHDGKKYAEFLDNYPKNMISLKMANNLRYPDRIVHQIRERLSLTRKGRCRWENIYPLV